ncbi:hypothetical protein [Primorskyibacter sp. S187A]|uniref:hypothetical protein n=1 Tax=Primorskyibacter sp. S187A TaxID=3415130 RepID=UPI003C7AA5AF
MFKKSATFPRMRPLGRRLPAPPMTDALIEARLSMPVCKETPEETGTAAIFEMGRDMARQDAWDELAALIMHHDQARDMTAEGTPLAELLSAGARSDLVMALQSIARSGRLSQKHGVLEDLASFCTDLNDPALGYGGAVLAADALMDAGWAWYEQGVVLHTPKRHLPEFCAMFERAAATINGFDATQERSSILAALQAALLAGNNADKRAVIKAYETLIGLNPDAPGHLRAYGLHLLPQWFGSHGDLELQARRCAVQTHRTWGNGGYTWVWLDALALDPAGFAFLDTDFFLDGIDDILARRSSQHFVNLFAAYLSRFIDVADGKGPDRAQRKALVKRRAGLVRGRMEELHPWVWALGPLSNCTTLQMDRTRRATLFEDGHNRAWDAVAHVFATELKTPSARRV